MAEQDKYASRRACPDRPGSRSYTLVAVFTNGGPGFDVAAVFWRQRGYCTTAEQFGFLQASVSAAACACACDFFSFAARRWRGK